MEGEMKKKMITRIGRTMSDLDDVTFYTFEACLEVWRDKKTAIKQAKEFYGVELINEKEH